MIGFDLNDVSNINIGNITIGSVYVGNTKIWEDGPAPHDYEQDYFTTVAKGNGNIGFSITSDVPTTNLTSISYSTDNGSTWTTTNNVDSQAVTITVAVNNGDKVLWKGVGNKMYTDKQNYAKFTSTTNFDVEGNIMSLLNGDNYYHSTIDTNSKSQFNRLFYNAGYLQDASNLILPATTLAYYCYMDMFSGCTSLTAAPELPATTLANGCYFTMFKDCTSLTTAPDLPATTLNIQCYSGMFYGCTNLNYIKMLTTDISATLCLDGWVNGVSATGTFVKDANTTIPTGTSGIPDGWAVINQ